MRIPGFSVMKKPKRPSAKWRKLFEVIPGYDPEAGADEYYFDEEAAQQGIDFFASCVRHVKGPLAGQPYVLSDWEAAVVACVLGYKHRDTHLRRYRQVFIFVPKKNSKTTLICGLLLLHLMLDNEAGAEIYSAASTKDQASIIFRDAAAMIAKDRNLRRALKVYGSSGGAQQRSIHYDAMDSFYRPLAADAGGADGANVHVALVDELHRHEDNGDMLDILERGTSAREQPIVYILTTSDYDRESACNRKHAEACRVRDNGGDPTQPGYDLEFLPVIYEAPKTADWTDPKVWAMANPGLGTSKSYAYMEKACRKAQEDPISKNRFLRYDLNIRTQETDALIPMDFWEQCPDTVNAEELVGHECYAGLDLATRDDIAALCLLFPPMDRNSGEWKSLYWFWCCERSIQQRQRQGFPYEVWRDSGHLIETGDDDVDFETIRRTIIDLYLKYGILEVGYDPKFATEMTQKLYNDDGVNVKPIRQNETDLNEPTKKFLSLIKRKKFNHGGNPVLKWMAQNTMGKVGQQDTVFPIKGKSKDKIDGIMATVMAIGRAMDNQAAEPKCVVF